MVLADRPWYVALIVALVSVGSSTVGDLSESLLKRDLGVKDMGSIFPGHGGMLDRIDSIVMWAPFCYVMIAG
jgi:phosphatidate cytidylyltransferase